VRSIVSVCAVAALVAVTVLCPRTASAAARAYKTLRLRQDTPIAATGGGSCPGVATDHDGWHFIVKNHPGTVAFTSISVTFDPGGTQTITSFAGQTDAYVSSELGARLTGAEAEVYGGLLTLLVLVHFDLAETCAGKAPEPSLAASSAVPVPRASSSPPARPAPGKPSKSAAAASASPSASGSVTPSVSGPDLPGGVEDQPEIQLNSPAIPTITEAREDQPALGFQDFVLIAAGIFLVLFGGISTFILVRRRKAPA
jgi:hypothetical protein